MSSRKRRGGIVGFLLPIIVIATVIGGVFMIDPYTRSELFNRVLAHLPILKNYAVVNTVTGYFGVNIENRDFLITKVYDVDYLLSLKRGKQYYIAIYPFTVEAGLKFDGKEISPVLRDGKTVYDLPPISFNAARDRAPVIIRGNLDANWDSTVKVAVDAFKSKARADAVRDGIIEDARDRAVKYFKQYASDDVVYNVPSDTNFTRAFIEAPHMAMALPKVIFDETGYEVRSSSEEAMPMEDMHIGKTERNVDYNVKVGFYEKNRGRFEFPNRYSRYLERVTMTFHDPASPKDKRVTAFFEPNRYNIHAFVQIENNVYQFYSDGDSENARRNSMTMLLLSAMTANYKENPKHDKYAEYVANCVSFIDHMMKEKGALAKLMLDKILAYDEHSPVSRLYNSVYQTLYAGKYVSCDVEPLGDLMDLYHYMITYDYDKITDGLIERITEHKDVKGTDLPSKIDDFIAGDSSDNKLKNVQKYKKQASDRLVQRGVITYNLRKGLPFADYAILVRNAVDKHRRYEKTPLTYEKSHGLNVWYDKASKEKVLQEYGEEAIWNWHKKLFGNAKMPHEAAVFVIETPAWTIPIVGHSMNTNYSILIVDRNKLTIYDDPIKGWWWNRDTVNYINFEDLNFSNNTLLAGANRKYTNSHMVSFLRELKASTPQERVDKDIKKFIIKGMCDKYGREINQ